MKSLREAGAQMIGQRLVTINDKNRRGENHERRNPSRLLSGNGNM